MATITNTKAVFDSKNKKQEFLDRVYGRKSVEKNKYLEETSKRVKKIKSLNINGEIIKVK